MSILCLLLLLNANIVAQNRLPVLNNITAVADTGSHTVSIHYSVSDEDNDSLKVTCIVTNSSGERVQVDAGDIRGDIGYPVCRGKDKSVWWKFRIPGREIGQYTITLVADDLQTVDISHLVNQVDTQHLKNDLQAIYGMRDMHSAVGRSHLDQVRTLLKARFLGSGLSLKTQPLLTSDSIKGYNILGDQQGLDNQAHTYVLCAHYDGAPGSPAADDNGSGVAGMLEVLNVLSKYQFSHNIRFIAFDMEENGCIGSRTYVNGILQSREQLAGVINLDMIGFYSDDPGSQIIPEGFDVLFPDACKQIKDGGAKGNFLVSITNDSSNYLAADFQHNATDYVSALNCITLTTPDNGTLTPTMSSGDHGSFWQAGYKAIFIGDGGETRDIYLDTPKDVLENINYGFLSKNVKAIIASLAKWGGIRHVATQHTGIRFK